MKKDLMQSLMRPRALILMALAAVAGIAQLFGMDAFGFVRDNPALGLLMLTGEIDAVQIKTELAKIGDQVKEHGEKALAEAQKGIAMSEGVKQTVDELLAKQGEFQAQLQELEQKAARQGEAREQLKSMGFQLIENEDFKKAHAAGSLVKKGSSMSFEVKNITTATSNVVQPDQRPGVNQLPNRRLTIRDLIAPGRTSSNLVNYITKTGFTNNAAPVAEGTAKPQSEITHSLVGAPVKKLAHYMKASTEILDDFPALQSQIDARLFYGLKLIEENQLLKGSGAGNNLNGIYTQATAYAAPITIASATIIDTLRLMLLQAELAEYPSDGIVLHPSDWAAIELTKDSTGQYIIGNPQGTLSPTLWGRSVVATQAMTQDTALAGAFQLGAQIFDRMDAAITIATENQDDFINNLVTILIEERLALAVYRTEAFVKNANLDGSV